MLEAEEFGVTSANVDSQLKSNNPNVQRILGVTPGMGKNLGVDDKWAYNIVKQVGNYGESFERNLGMASAMKPVSYTHLDPAAEHQGRADVAGRQQQAFAHADLSVFLVQHAQVEDQQGDDDADEQQPAPGRRAGEVGL